MQIMIHGVATSAVITITAMTPVMLSLSMLVEYVYKNATINTTKVQIINIPVIFSRL